MKTPYWIVRCLPYSILACIQISFTLATGWQSVFACSPTKEPLTPLPPQPTPTNQNLIEKYVKNSELIIVGTTIQADYGQATIQVEEYLTGSITDSILPIRPQTASGGIKPNCERELVDAYLLKPGDRVLLFLARDKDVRLKWWVAAISPTSSILKFEQAKLVAISDKRNFGTIEEIKSQIARVVPTEQPHAPIPITPSVATVTPSSTIQPTEQGSQTTIAIGSMVLALSFGILIFILSKYRRHR
ncbi:MAG: hypothetical protein HZC40_04800 [Chloroflexi bacterium]|nr:hypothetical protein [Chloroflexota bacterium]